MARQVKLIGFDLDGTLTQHKTPIEIEHEGLLRQLHNHYSLVMVAAGSCQRVFEQLLQFPIDIIGNYGMERSTTVMEGSDIFLRLLSSEKVSQSRSRVYDRITRLRNHTGYTGFQGDSVEFHNSGVLTFPLLGTEADAQEKLRFDPGRRKRRAIYSIVQEAFWDHNVFIGGTSSFDIVPKPFDKFHALNDYAKERGITLEEVLYVGDDFGPGGNDEPVMKGGISCVTINDYRDLTNSLSAVLPEPI